MENSKIVTRNGEKYLVTETKLMTNHRGEVNWLVNFKSGGWNSVWANTEKQALKVANKEYSRFGVRNVVPLTSEMYEHQLRMTD